MELSEFSTVDHIRDDKIRQLAVDGSRTAVTRHYLAREDGREVGFLAADVDPDDSYFVIYTIFVPRSLRRHGIGARLLKAAEDLGKHLGFTQVLLRAKTLNPDYLQEDLVAWYQRNGYSISPDSNGALVKNLGVSETRTGGLSARACSDSENRRGC
jgi:GNAT superfamily N-acetyltransferase